MNETGLQYAEELLKRYNGTPDEWDHLQAIKARLISAAPEMLEVLRWLDAEMDCRDNFGGCLFSIHDFEKVRRAIKLAMEG